MGYVVKMPKLGLEMEQGTVLEWYVGEGDEIDEDDVLLEVESEKSIGEVEAREDGVLRLLAIGEGETVPPGTPVGIVADGSEDIADLEAEFEAEDGEGREEEPATDAESEAATGTGTTGGVGTSTASGAAPGTGPTDVKASPRARRRAEELGIGLASVDGTGPQGAITADDVDAAAAIDTEPSAEGEEATRTELHPQAEGLLHDLSAAGVPPLYRQSVPEARATYRDLCVSEGEPEPVERVADGEVPGPGGSIPVRVYDPAPDTTEARAALAFFHGGGWMTGDIPTHDAACRALANEVGEIVVSVDYRRAPEHRFPAALEDCYAVTAWLTGDPDLGALDPDLTGTRIDPYRVAVGGDSVGGTLAAGVTLLARDRGSFTPCYQLLIYPATDHRFDTESYIENANGYFVTRNDMERFWDGHLESDLDGHHPYASPLRAPSLADVPPATVLTCGFDPLRDDGNDYADRLDEAGVRVSRLTYPDMIHGFLTMLSDPEWERAREAISDLAADLDRALEA